MLFCGDRMVGGCVGKLRRRRGGMGEIGLGV